VPMPRRGGTGNDRWRPSRLRRMAAHHGNTPAAWAAVVVALVGFTVGGVGLMLHPVSYPVFWVGVAITVTAAVVFVVMDRMGLGDH